MIERLTPEVMARFWLKVDMTGDCWEWQACGLSSGYGTYGTGDRKMRLAHRISMTEHLGRDIEPGMQVDHLCRNTSCVRPSHLEVVTPRVNTLRSANPAADNSRKTHCTRGHAFDAANTLVRNGGRGRGCRLCRDGAYRRRLALHTTSDRTSLLDAGGAT